MDFHEEEQVEEKVAKLNLVVKEYKKGITNIQFYYEININELWMNVQTTMSPEVREKRESNLKTVVAGIFASVIDCGKLLDETLQFWTSL